MSRTLRRTATMISGGASMGSMTRRTFGAAVGTLALSALPARAKADAAKAKLKIGVLLPRSGLQALIGQSCQKGADIAPDLIRQRLGVEIEIMNADTESNVDTARSRAERLIGEGAHVLVGAFDSGHTAAIAQVAEQHGVPHIVNIAAAPQITEQGYKFVFRNFPARARDRQERPGPAQRHLRRGEGRAEDGRVHVRQRHLRAIDGEGCRGAPAHAVACRSSWSTRFPYDPAAKDLTVEVSKAKATNAELLLLVCRLNDAIVLRREMVKQRWSPMGVVSPGSPGLYEEQFAKVLGKHAQYCISNTVWFNPKNGITQAFAAGVQEAVPEGRARVSRDQRDLHLRRDPDRGGRVQTRQDHRPEGAGGGDPADQHRRHGPRHLWRTDQVQRQGSGRGEPVGRPPEPGRQAHRRSAQGVRRSEARVSRASNWGERRRAHGGGGEAAAGARRRRC